MGRRKLFGLDLFEVVVQAVVTFALIATITNYPGRSAETLATGVAIASLFVLAWRRKRALSADPGSAGGGERMEDLEDRVAELEQAQQRILELEERLDFAERVLAQGRHVPISPARPEGER